MATTQQYSWPSSSNVSITGIGNPVGQPTPPDAIYIAGSNPEGDLTGVAVTDEGYILTTPSPTSVQHVIVDSSALPAGAATSALQTSGNASLTSIDGKVATAANQTTEITALQAIEANQTNGTQVTQLAAGSALIGTVSINQTTPGTTNGVVVNSSALPTGAATETTLSAINTKTPALGQAAMAASVPVAIASNQSAIPISASSLPLPTGAATETTLAAMSAKLPATLGQKASAASMAVVLASDQPSIPVAPTASVGRSKANAPTVTTYATPVTSSAYVQIIASTTTAANLVEIFDSSGVALIFAVGGSGSEVDQFVIYPGGNGQVPLAIPAGSRISYKAVSTSATGASAYNVLNLYT